jgi:hypothetical protein
MCLTLTTLGQQSLYKSFPAPLLVLVLSKWLPYHPSKTMICQVYIYLYDSLCNVLQKKGEIFTAAFLASSLKPLVLLQCVNLNRSIAVGSVSLYFSCFWNVHKHRMTLAMHMLKYTRKRKTFSNTCMLSYNHMTW